MTFCITEHIWRRWVGVGGAAASWVLLGCRPASLCTVATLSVCQRSRGTDSWNCAGGRVSLHLCPHQERCRCLTSRFLSKLLRKSVLQKGKPVVEGCLDKKLPFGQPSIEQGVKNFIRNQFSYLSSKERQTTAEFSSRTSQLQSK